MLGYVYPAVTQLRWHRASVIKQRTWHIRTYSSMLTHVDTTPRTVRLRGHSATAQTDEGIKENVRGSQTKPCIYNISDIEYFC